MSKELQDWTLDRLSALLGLPVEELGDMLPSLIQAKTKNQVEDQLFGMLGNSKDVTEFVEEFCHRSFNPTLQSVIKQHDDSNSRIASSPQSYSKSVQKEQQPPLQQQFKNQENVYRKSDNDLVYFAGAKKKPIPKEEQKPEPVASSQQSTPLSRDTIPVATRETAASTTSPNNKKARKGQAKASGMSLTEFDKLTTASGAFAGSKRVQCDCLASKHGLLTNCLNCGRVICNLEGPGECFTCKSLVVSKDQQRQQLAARVIQRRDSVDAVYEISQEQGQREAFDRAERTKERLLEYDRNSTQRTKVHDSASDFDLDAAAQDKWSTPEQRALALRKAQQQKRAEEEKSRRRVMTIDVVNKRVTVMQPTDDELTVEPEAIVSTTSVEKSTLTRQPNGNVDTTLGSGLFINPSLTQRPAYVQVEVPVITHTRKRPPPSVSAEQPIDEFIPGMAPKQPPPRKQSVETKSEATTKQTPPTTTQSVSNSNSKRKPRLQFDFRDDILFLEGAQYDSSSALGDEPAS
ncbi:hypothetical protein SmJEL517_g04739 [Synchytrium microbalum]|uniref:TRIP4/RQT4 C2HC5-type zinc finger domain-containing protein n=1 Tax=Synchytrium microbalum TaxID=1806994 RepID=A0A507C1W8_9FUNG|nr:uncharacterized protein SmJEL517_g04739 [Synchytrium microbalum]TPX32074.1 hypothetical protein SmJEL517_g04739 [Synchytrium microbalum]